MVTPLSDPSLGIVGGEPESFGLKISPAPGVQPNLYDVLALLNPKLHFNYYHLTKPIMLFSRSPVT